MQIIEFTSDSLRFLDAVPTTPTAGGFVWIYLEREEWDANRFLIQNAAMQLGGSSILELHAEDLTNAQHPSHYDYTSVYDLLIFRRLATQAETMHEVEQERAISDYHGQAQTPQQKKVKKNEPGVLQGIRSKAVGFVVFDRLLVSLHPRGCYSAKTFVDRFVQDAKTSVDAASVRSRIPTSPADLSLRMVNAMVDSYLDLRKELSARLDYWQGELLKPSSRFNNWGALMQARGQLHVLEELCDEQHDAVQEWLDAIRESPLSQWGTDIVVGQAQRDQLTARARDVMEHIERVLHHARRLEQSAETVVQIHFSAQSNRTNDIMRTLTALTAIFLPLNLIAGIFGMNFEFIPWIHSRGGFWWAIGSMVLTAAVLGFLFWRKQYLARTRG